MKVQQGELGRRKAGSPPGDCVPPAGLEPACPKAATFKVAVSADFTTGAWSPGLREHSAPGGPRRPVQLCTLNSNNLRALLAFRSGLIANTGDNCDKGHTTMSVRSRSLMKPEGVRRIRAPCCCSPVSPQSHNTGEGQNCTGGSLGCRI